MKLPMVVTVVGLALAVGCKKKENAAPTPDVGSGAMGSGSSAGTADTVATGSGAGSGSTVAAGSGSGSGSAGPTSAASSLVISQQGVGPISVKVKADDDEAMKQAIATQLEPLGLTVSDEVMDMPGEVEHEEGYLSVKKGDTEVLQIFRGNDVDPDLVIHVVAPMFATADGINVGDPLSVLADKRKDLACNADSDEELGTLICKSPKEPDVLFVLSATGWKGKDGKLDLAKNAARAIVEIVR